MTLRSLKLALVFGASLAALAPASAQEPLKVVASFSILGDMVREIGGEHVAVTTLVGPNGDAHVFEPSPKDARAIGEAKVLVTNGLNFEGWMPRLVDTAEFKGETVVASAGVSPRAFTAEEAEKEEAEEHGAHADHAGETAEAGHDHSHGAVDPHAWQDLRNGEIYARNIAEGLAKADPDNAADYRAKGDAYVAELKALDTQIRDELAAIPNERRKVVTSHDAFGYFAGSYGIEFIAPEGVSTESEASAGDVAKIIDQIRAENISAVFVENISDTRLIDQIARETGARIGGSLFSDALSDADGPAPTYEQMFRSNAAEIVNALKTS